MLGYEGYIRVGGNFVLGTGSSVPRARARLDSSSGYGGQKETPANEMGIGAPRAYDWDVHDGSVNFEMTLGLFTTLKAWMFARQTSDAISLVSRDGNVQTYSNAYWNSISLSAADGSAVEGSVGFVAIVRTAYSYGTLGEAGYTGNINGQGVVCASDPLNPGGTNLNPIPFWNTEVSLGGSTFDFLTWSLDLSQDMVKFFACTHTGGADPGPKEPEYLAAGPMTVALSGTYIYKAPTADSLLTGGLLDVAGTTLTLNKMELQSISDDVQTGEALVPLSVEYAVYEIAP